MFSYIAFKKSIAKDKNYEEKTVYFRIAKLLLWNINWIHHSAELVSRNISNDLEKMEW